MFLGDIAASDLWKQIIDTREVLAALRNSVGQQDTFTVPAGLVRTSDGPDGGNTGNVLASKITCEILGRPFTSIHNVKRSDWNAALASMNTAIQTLKSPTGSTTSTAPTVPVVSTGTPAVPTLPVTAVPSTGVTTGSGNTLLYVLAGGAAILFFLRGRKGMGVKRMTRHGVKVVRKHSRKRARKARR